MIAILREVFGTGHVAGDRMIAYLDRELPRWRSRRVRDHLSRCEKCRREFQAIQAGLAAWETASTGALTPSPAALLAGRERLLRALRGWAVMQQPSGQGARVARAAEELSIFAQSSGDYLRLHADSAGARQALNHMEPLLEAFLGKATASSLRTLVAGILPPDVNSMVSEAV